VNKKLLIVHGTTEGHGRSIAIGGAGPAGTRLAG